MLCFLCVCVNLQGVLRIHFLEAQDLEGKDKLFGGLIKGKSDPYGVVQVANQTFQSKTIKECLNPKWNEVFEVSVDGEEWLNMYNFLNEILFKTSYELWRGSECAVNQNH